MSSWNLDEDRRRFPCPRARRHRAYRAHPREGGSECTKTSRCLQPCLFAKSEKLLQIEKEYRGNAFEATLGARTEELVVRDARLAARQLGDAARRRRDHRTTPERRERQLDRG